MLIALFSLDKSNKSPDLHWVKGHFQRVRWYWYRLEIWMKTKQTKNFLVLYRFILPSFLHHDTRVLLPAPPALKKVCLTRNNMFYFKNGQHQNNSVCLAICVGVLALIWYLLCDKRAWNYKVLNIWLTLGHIRKVAFLKFCTRLHLSCWCHPGSPSTRTVFYLASSR